MCAKSNLGSPQMAILTNRFGLFMGTSIAWVHLRCIYMEAIRGDYMCTRQFGALAAGPPASAVPIDHAIKVKASEVLLRVKVIAPIKRTRSVGVSREFARSSHWIMHCITIWCIPFCWGGGAASCVWLGTRCALANTRRRNLRRSRRWWSPCGTWCDNRISKDNKYERQLQNLVWYFKV